jgi:excisionase family DNA binding protein
VKDEARPTLSLDTLARQPELAVNLAPDAAHALRRKLVVALAALSEAEARQPAPPQGARESLLDAKEAAEILRVPVTWLREAARQGRVRCIRLGHYVRFRHQDLAQFIADGGTPDT